MRKLDIIGAALSLAVLAGCNSGPDPESEGRDSEPTTAVEADPVATPTQSSKPETKPAEDEAAKPKGEKKVAAGPPGSKAARCKISSGGGPRTVDYDGPCRFLLGAKGSFSISRADEEPFGDSGSGLISVTMGIPELGPGVANVRGLTELGINSNWGDAVRDTQDKACWNGTDFQVCAY